MSDNNFDGIGRKLLKSVAVSLLLTSVLIFFGPLTIYLNNAPEFEFTVIELIQNLAIPLLVYFSALLAILMILPQRWRLYQTGLLLCLALGIAAWMQAVLLPWSHGVFDGTKIEWERYTSRYIIDGLLWGFVGIVFIVKRKAICRNAHKLALGLLMIQTVGFAVLYADIREDELRKPRFQLSEVDKFSFSKQRNVLVIVLDTTEVPLFQKALANHPDYEDKLDGFYFFPDTLSSYPSTLAAFAQMLTDKLYKNEEPFDVFKKKAFLSETSLPKRLKEEGTHAFLESLYPRTFFIDPAVADNVVEGKAFEMDDHLLLLSLFRQLPFPAKRYLMEEAADLSLSSFLPRVPGVEGEEESRFLDRSEVPYPEDLSLYYDGLNHSVRYDFNHFFNTDLSQPSFKFFHMLGTHRHNRNFTKSKSRLEDIDVCMEYIFDVIDTFKKNDIYDNSVIAILADHGARVCGDVSKANFNAILLVKPMHSSGSMKVSDRSMSLSDLSPLLYALSTTNHPCQGNLDNYFALHPSPETRYVYHYIWHGWENVYLPQLTEYAVTGSVESNALIATGRSYVKRDRDAITFSGEAVIDFTNKKKSECLEGVWKQTTEGVVPEEKSWEAPSVVLHFSKPLTPNASYHAQLVYANPVVDPSQTNGVAVRHGLSEYVRLEASEGVITQQLPVRIYSRANKELRFKFKVPTNSQFVLKSLSIFADPLPRVLWNKRYELSTSIPENAALLGQGWHRMEPGFTWAGSEGKALLRFSVDAPESDLAFKFTGGAFIKPGSVDHQRVGIFANGRKLREIEMTQMEDQDYYVEIPRELVASNELTIRFDLPDATVPVEVGGFDIRPLAIRVASISLEEIGMHYVEGPDNMSSYLSSGWSWAEQDRIWNDGHKAELGFRVGTPTDDLEFIFRCKALIVSGNVDRQRIIVSANGKELCTLEKTTPETECFTVVIPKELVTNGEVHIQLELPDAVSPQQAGINGDSRELAIALTSILLKE